MCVVRFLKAALLLHLGACSCCCTKGCILCKGTPAPSPIANILVLVTGGAVMARLHEPPHPSSPSPRQPALMIGWSELEALLLNRLPPGTVVSVLASQLQHTKQFKPWFNQRCVMLLCNQREWAGLTLLLHPVLQGWTVPKQLGSCALCACIQDKPYRIRRSSA